MVVYSFLQLYLWSQKITLGPEGTCVKFTLCECFHRVGVCILVLVGGSGGCLYSSGAGGVSVY